MECPVCRKGEAEPGERCTSCRRTIVAPVSDPDFFCAIAPAPNSGETKPCVWCAEPIRAEARLCRFCQRQQPGTRSAHPKKSRDFLKGVGVFAAAVVLVLVVFAVIGIGPSTGSNAALYDALRVYASPMTQQTADQTVDDIRDQLVLSRREAEQVVIQCVRAGMSTRGACLDFAHAAAGLARLRNEGVIN